MRARLASVATLAAVGVLAIAGCGRAQPGVAAYVGNTDITETRVTAIIDEVKDAIGEAEPARLPKRGVVVSTLVLNDVCARFSADDNLKPQNPVTAEQVAQAFGVPPTTGYAQETAKLYTCLSGLPAGQPVAPTAEELADIVARGKEAGAIPQDVPIQQAAAQLDGDQLRAALASRKVLADAVTKYDVTVNPRYRPLEFPVLSFQGNAAAVTVPLGEADSGAVTDVSTSAPAPDGSAAPGA
jgi:hypothetical protein